MFPSWRYHAEKGSRLFANPDELDEAGPDWYESPADVGLVPEAPQNQGNTLMIPSPEQDPEDESVATAEEAEASAARAARNANRASTTTSPQARNRALAAKGRGKK